MSALLALAIGVAGIALVATGHTVLGAVALALMATVYLLLHRDHTGGRDA